MKATVYNMQGTKVKELELAKEIFGVQVNPHIMSQVIVAQQANARKVIADTKDKSEIRGGGRKPWRQKGTGRARHGSIRSPLWRGGGITFGPTTERNFTQKVNKKVKRQALLMSLSDKAAHEKIVLIDQFVLPEVKTKKFFETLQALKLRSARAVSKSAETNEKKGDSAKKKVKRPMSVLVVLSEKSDAIVRAAKNIPRVTVIRANSLNIVDVVKHQYMLMGVDAVNVIEKTYVK